VAPILRVVGGGGSDSEQSRSKSLMRSRRGGLGPIDGLSTILAACISSYFHPWKREPGRHLANAI
jgi:hypothetical protein